MSTTTTKIAKSSALNAKQRERLETLFIQRFRPDPMPRMTVKPSLPETHDSIVATLKTWPEYAQVKDALQALVNATSNFYGTRAVIGVQANGDPLIQYDRYASDDALDLVSTIRRDLWGTIQQANKDLREAYQADYDAWKLERQEKITAIHTARSIEELLLIVPELRVNLPTEADRTLNSTYTPMQITASSVVIDV